MHRHARVPHDLRHGVHDGRECDGPVGAEAAGQELASHERVALTDHDHAQAWLVREERQRLEFSGGSGDLGALLAADQDQRFVGTTHGALHRPQARGGIEFGAPHHAHVVGTRQRALVQGHEGGTVHVVERTADPAQVSVATARSAHLLAGAFRVFHGQGGGGLERREGGVGAVTAGVIGKETDEDVQGCRGDVPRRGSRVVSCKRICMLAAMSTDTRSRWPGLRVV